MFSFRTCLVILVWAAALSHAAALNTPAPSFALLNSQKQVRTPASYKGKIVFINFWASWCAPCQIELPELNRLASEYEGKKVRVLAINVDRSRNAAKELLAKLGLTAPHLEILWDTKSRGVSAFNISEMPSSFVLDQRGVIRYLHNGFHPTDPPAWRKEINELLHMHSNR